MNKNKPGWKSGASRTDNKKHYKRKQRTSKRNRNNNKTETLKCTKCRQRKCAVTYVIMKQNEEYGKNRRGRQCTYKVTLRSVRATIVAEEKK